MIPATELIKPFTTIEIASRMETTRGCEKGDTVLA